jgi:hypothetical protein
MLTRTIITLAASFFIARSVGEGAPSRTPAYYFATAVGTKWTYESDDGTWSETVTEVDSRDGEKIVSIVHGRADELNWKVAVSINGLSRIQCRGDKDDPPVCWLKLPAKVGETWRPWGDKSTDTAEVVGFEDVEVPAGKFHAVLVKTTVHPVSGFDWSYIRCFAPGIGLVKLVTGDRVQVLKSITPKPR